MSFMHRRAGRAAVLILLLLVSFLLISAASAQELTPNTGSSASGGGESGSGGAAQQDDTLQESVEEHTGTLDDDNEIYTYPVTLTQGQTILVTAEATSGNLDTVVTLYAPGGEIAANNDDRSGGTYDSAMAHTAEESGIYTVELTRYDGSSSGDFLLTITVGDESLFDVLAELTNVDLSGETLTRDTAHFRIHYTLEGSDSVTQNYVEAVAQAVEEVYQIMIVDMGWPAPPSDEGQHGGSVHYDIYLIDLIGGGEDALGITTPLSIVGDNPNSPEEEEYAATSYISVDNDFDDTGEDPISLMRTTVAHEFHHAVQFGYDVNDSHNWVYEATASWIETVVTPADEDATGYVEYAYQYPELCFGTIDDPEQGSLQYGEWTFLQFMADAYGMSSIQAYWRNIGKFEGFEALEQTLASYGSNVPESIGLYRTKNLAREYRFAPAFNATVWLEETITDVGRWTFTGEGVQELGANYFKVELDAGTYYAGLTNDSGKLEIWAIGVDSERVTTIPLGRGGSFDTTPYSSMYLMVFNPNYDDDLTDCEYYDYDIDVTTSKGDLAPTGATWSAEWYESLD